MNISARLSLIKVAGFMNSFISCKLFILFRVTVNPEFFPLRSTAIPSAAVQHEGQCSADLQQRYAEEV